jgi:hypothetical protein
LSVRTFAPPFFSVIVRPGPVVPVSAIADGAVVAVDGRARKTRAPRAASMSRIRNIVLLLR